MTLANASAQSADGSTVAMHSAANKEHQLVMLADAQGHILGSRDEFLAFFPPQTNANGRELAELFNGDATGKIVRVRGVWIVPNMAAVTGAAVQLDLNRISSAGSTGRVAVTPRPLDTAQAALDADVTAGYGSTAGAALVHLLFSIYSFNEETNAGNMLLPYFNLLPTFGDRVCEIVLRQNEGIQLKQVTANTVGATGAMIHFVIE